MLYGWRGFFIGFAGWAHSGLKSKQRIIVPNNTAGKEWEKKD